MAHSQPLVSIVIPVWNRQKFIHSALESALAQTYPNIEVVVVDNCSTDRTYEIIEEYARHDARIRPFRNEQNLGPVRNWKKAVERSSGDFIKILFSDDWIEPPFVARCMELLLASESVGFACTSAIVHCEKGKYLAYDLQKDGLHPSERCMRELLLGFDSFSASPGNALFRRRDVEKNLLIDIPNTLGLDFPRLGCGVDALLFLCTADDYPYFGFVSEPLAHFRVAPNGITLCMHPRDLSLHHAAAMTYYAATCQISEEMRRKVYTRFYLSLVGKKKKFGVLADMSTLIGTPVELTHLDYGQLLQRTSRALWRRLLGNRLRFIRYRRGLSGLQ